jgi:predicted HAD superfamily Cof-like phosphohydrolase
MTGKRGRPEAKKPRELTKRQRWTVEEWAEVEKASAIADETPSGFIRAAALQHCRKKTR